MKIKLFFSLILIFLLTSCGDHLPTGKITSKPYIVITVSQFSDNGNTSNKLCVYLLSTGTDYTSFIDNITVVDSIGKFAIGDTAQLLLVKRY